MSDRLDQELRRAHERFVDGHGARRAELLARLEAADGRAGILAPIRGRQHRLARPAVAAAAALGFALSVWWLVLRAPSTAYALNDVPARLSTCHGVLVEGWRLANGVRHPVRLYADASFYTLATFSVQGARTSGGYVIDDSRRYLSVMDSDRTAITGAADPFTTEVRARLMIQSTIPDTLIGDSAAEFRRARRSETLRGLRCDRYERDERDGAHRVVWVDRATGLPAEVSLRRRVEGREQEELRLSVYPNAARPSDVPSFEPPAGYRVRERDMTPRSALGWVGGSAGQTTFSLLAALNLDDRAILMCYVRYHTLDGAVTEPDLGGPVGRPVRLDVRSEGGGAEYRTFHLRDDPWEEGRHARWMLLLPNPRPASVGNAVLTLTEPRGRVHIEIAPVRFPDERLGAVVQQLQHLTSEGRGAGAEFLTLQDLRALIRRFDEGAQRPR